MSKYTTILFDADGTLFDFDKAETFALKSALTERGLPYNETILSAYKKINADLWLLLEQGKTTQSHLRDKRFEILIEHFDMDDSAQKICNAFIKYLSQATFFLPGAQDMLKSLSKTHSLYLVTNGITEVQESRFALSGISSFFKDMFISEKLGVSKPSPKYFDIVFENIGIQNKEHAIIVGDSLTSDIAGGNNAGIATCWYNPEEKLNDTDSVCDYTIARLSELSDILL